MEKKRIFLASSSELKEERDSFARFIREINEFMTLQNIELDAEQWEFKDKAVQGQRLQDMYNETLANCEICVVLFWKRCGKYTQEELDFAYNKFKEGLNPKKIYVFFKQYDEKTASQTLKTFRDDYPKRYNENFPIDYSSIDEWRFNLFLQIAKYYGDDPVKLEFNNHLIDFSKLPCFIRNKDYSEVLASYKKALRSSKKYPQDKVFQDEKERCEAKLNGILSDLIKTAGMVEDYVSHQEDNVSVGVNKAIIHYYEQCQYDEVKRIIEKIKNPFILQHDIKPELYCDRVKECESIDKRLLHGENILLIGPRRSGKTTFIKNRLWNSPVLKDSHYLVYCDLFWMETLEGFALCLYNTIKDVVRDKKNFIEIIRDLLKSISPTIGITAGGFEVIIGGSDHILDPITTIDKCFNLLEGLDKPCIVCFDEFQSVKNDTSGRIESLVYKYMNALKNVRFVFVGCPRYYSDLPALGINHSIIESSTFFTLGPIKKEEYLTFAQHWFKVYSKKLNPSEFYFVYDYCKGSPYYIQRVLHRLFGEIDCGQTCQQEKVMVVIDSLIREATPMFEQVLSRMTLTERLILYQLSEEEYVNNIRAFIKKHKFINTSFNTVHHLFEKLMCNEWISYYDNKYYIEDVFFGHYLKAHGEIIQSQEI